MDRNQLEQLGEELRGIGHRRRELAEQIFQEVQEGDNQASKELYQELSHISNQAIDIMTRQKNMFDQEVQRL
ncbi:hypothetical protein JMM81_15095 [Bacillus sp. V3B]|uniref:hypothetical protein n=1 Tax=Bacillus sp. V3B TaxID=2804915 RepID=UPI0021093B0B|nr:hypothetical protein [Bacillus sp. V3B]MCQ6276252.1 hypothetical protein [Bacillus sp. V3B]